MTSNKPSSGIHKDSEINAMIERLTDFQYLLLVAAMDTAIGELLKRAFLFFTHESVVFSLDPAQIIIGPVEEKHIMTEDKFYDF